ASPAEPVVSHGARAGDFGSQDNLRKWEIWSSSSSTISYTVPWKPRGGAFGYPPGPMARPECANVPVRVRFRSGHVISAQYLEHQATSGPNEASTDQCVTGQTVQTSDYGSVLTPLE